MSPFARGRSRGLAWVAVGALTVLVFAADVVTGSELSFSLFYLAPVACAAWFLGRSDGWVASLAAVIGWITAYRLTGRSDSYHGVLAWNALMEAGTYATVAWAVSSIRLGMKRERALRTKLEAAVRRLDREERRVGDIQRGLMPSGPPELSGFAFATHYAPSTRAGGDYFDFLPLGERRLGILIADASGHGSSAAVVMAMLRVLVHEGGGDFASPARLLERLNRQLIANHLRDQFVTAAFVLLDAARGTVTLARAGHEPPLLVRAGGRGVVTLDADGGPPLGLFEAAAFGATTVSIEPGDTLLLWTDGLTEAQSRAGELFGAERLRAVADACAGERPEAWRDRLLDAARRHAADGAFGDDVSLVVVQSLATARDVATGVAPAQATLEAPAAT